MWKQHLFLIVHVKRIFQSIWSFGHRRVPPIQLRRVRQRSDFSTAAPYVAPQLITQEELAEDAS